MTKFLFNWFMIVCGASFMSVIIIYGMIILHRVIHKDIYKELQKEDGEEFKKIKFIECCNFGIFFIVILFVIPCLFFLFCFLILWLGFNL